MSELHEELKNEVRKIINETEPSEPIEIETKGVFDPSLLDSAGYPLPPDIDSFLDNPMGPFMGLLKEYLESLRPKPFEPIKSEHKVRIFCFDGTTDLEAIEGEIENLLNDGYCCHFPAVVCNEYAIMDFSRRKESESRERQERQTNNDGSDKEI